MTSLRSKVRMVFKPVGKRNWSGCPRAQYNSRKILLVEELSPLGEHGKYEGSFQGLSYFLFSGHPKVLMWISPAPQYRNQSTPLLHLNSLCQNTKHFLHLLPRNGLPDTHQTLNVCLLFIFPIFPQHIQPRHFFFFNMCTTSSFLPPGREEKHLFGRMPSAGNRPIGHSPAILSEWSQLPILFLTERLLQMARACTKLSALLRTFLSQFFLCVTGQCCSKHSWQIFTIVG